MECFPPRIRNRTGISPLTTFTQHYTTLASAVSQEQINKRYPDWKGRGKTVFIHRLHDDLRRKLYEINKKATRTN